MNTSRAAVVSNAILGKAASLIGYTGSFLFLVGAIASFSEAQMTGFIYSLILMLLFVLSAVKGARIKRRIKRFKRYVFLISSRHMTSLAELAAGTSQSVDFVRKDLQKMIDKKFFTNAVIDMSADEIIIAGRAASVPPPGPVPASAQSEPETFTCKGCGASGIKEKGQPGICEYCGSAVN